MSLGQTIKFRDIFLHYADDLNRVEQSLRRIFSSDASVIPMVGEHILGGGGKRLRPLFLLLSADIAGYRGEKRIILAGIVEAIHTASLLHDDVVDGAEVRRGNAAAHQIWGNQVVILVGDFCYANALKLAVFQEDLRVIEALSGAITAMTEGEIIQLKRVADPEIPLEEYIRIIAAKTGALISAACRIGGLLGGLSSEKEDALGSFGMKTGIAFQMADDILDYMADEKGLGKKLGKDLEEGKITLPLIYLLKAATADERAEVSGIIQSDALRKADLRRIMALFETYNVIEESLKIAQQQVAEAHAELNAFAPSPEREALLRLADFALERKN